MTGNREYKSDVFSMLMENPMNALVLYNALNGSSYTDPDMVEMCTLDKGISLSIRNDAAFVLDSNLSLYEHQSTVCPNMPIRNLIYFTNIVEPLVKKLEQCPFLKGYMIFVDYVRMYHKESNYEDLKVAISRAIDRCIEENVLRDFMLENRSEVMKVTNLDYTFERQLTLEREEGLELELKALIETCQEIHLTRSDTIDKIIEKYDFTPKDAAEKVDMYWKNI